MTADVDICNMALSRLGARATITSLTDTTPEAVKLALHYPLARDMLLEQHDWAFARGRSALAVSGMNVNGWAYAYARPADCFVFRGVFNGCAWPSPPIFAYEASGGLIMTNRSSAIGIYTKQITDLTVWSASLRDALAWQLAAVAAFDITGNQQTGPSLQKQAQATAEIAWAKDREQLRHEVRTEFVPEWLMVRGGGFGCYEW